MRAREGLGLSSQAISLKYSLLTCSEIKERAKSVKAEKATKKAVESSKSKVLSGSSAVWGCAHRQTSLPKRLATSIILIARL